MTTDYMNNMRCKIGELEGELDDALGREHELTLTIESLEDKISDLEQQVVELGGEPDE